MNDLYYELQNQAKEKAILVQSNQSSMMNLFPEFTKIYSQISLKLQVLKSNNQKIEDYRNQYRSSALPKQEKDLNKKIQVIQDSNTQSTSEIKQLVEKLNLEIKKSDPDEPETRSMNYQMKALQVDIADLLSSSQNAIYQFNLEVQNKMKRQLEILKPDITPIQKEMAMKDPQIIDKIIVEEVLGKSSLQVQYRVTDIQEKYQDILKLEKSAQYAFQLLSEIAFLVNQQSQQLDSIEQNLNKAKDYIERGEKHLANEKKEHQKSRKKLCCIILIGLVVIGVILTPVIMKIVQINS